MKDTKLKFIAYHKIKQFRDVIRDITHSSRFSGEDKDGNAIYNTDPLPTLEFTGTVKLHGTNAGICYNPKFGILPQKRSSFCGGTHGHFGFVEYVSGNSENIISLLDLIHKDNCSIDEQLTIYGEWAGQGVQRGVSISELPKQFYVFDALAYNLTTGESRWVDISDWIFTDTFSSINSFDTYTQEVDFNTPTLAQNKFVELTNSIEEKCPVASYQGKDGVGEGVVWRTTYKGVKYIFKVKGAKHSSSNTKNLAPIDEEKAKSKIDFIEYACTINRMDQAIHETNPTSKSDTGDVIRWLINDIMLEESSVLVNSGLIGKDVNSEISFKMRTHLFTYLDKL